MLEISTAAVTWDEDHFVPLEPNPTDMHQRRGVVNLGDAIEFRIRLLITGENLADAKIRDDLEIVCLNAIGFAVSKVLGGEIDTSLKEVVNIVVPVSENPANMIAFDPNTGREQVHPRFRYPHFMYYREDADGKAKLARTCQGGKTPDCHEYDLYTNMNSPEMIAYRTSVADLCTALAAVGIASHLVSTVINAASALEAKLPCRVANEAAEKAEAGETTMPKIPKSKHIH